MTSSFESKSCQAMETDISCLLGTNRVPSDTQAHEIRKLISIKKLDRNQLDFEIDQVRILLDKLMLQRDGVQQDIEAHEALLSPARRIFPEILGEIFERCLSPIDHREILQPFYLQPPILFTRVCSAWRRVALSSPRLWCSIFCHVPRQMTHVAGVIVDATAETWLLLSRDCPLSFTLYGDDSVPLQNWHDMAKIFLRHSSRWKCITLHQPHPSLQLFRVIGKDTSLLETIDITATRWKNHDDEGMNSLATTLQRSPRLHSLSWTSGWLDFPSSFLRIPWCQLRHVNLDCRLSLEDFIAIFPQLTRAESCALRRVWGDVPQIYLPRHSVSLPYMDTFHLSSAGDLELILTNIMLPAVTDLTIDHFNSSRGNSLSWSQPAFASLFPPSTCRLRRLALHVRVPISDNDLIQCLRIASSTLVELSLIGDMKVTDKVLHALMPTTLDDNCLGLCPKVEDIELLDCLYSSDGCLANMVESRWKPSMEWNAYAESYPGFACLRYVSFRMDSSQTLSHYMDAERLLGLVDKGLDGRIDHYVT